MSRSQKKLNKFKYISMMLSRNAIVRIAYDMCARAATIAIRYSAVRKQGLNPEVAHQEKNISSSTTKCNDPVRLAHWLWHIACYGVVDTSILISKNLLWQ